MRACARFWKVRPFPPVPPDEAKSQTAAYRPVWLFQLTRTSGMFRRQAAKGAGGRTLPPAPQTINKSTISASSEIVLLSSRERKQNKKPWPGVSCSGQRRSGSTARAGRFFSQHPSTFFLLCYLFDTACPFSFWLKKKRLCFVAQTKDFVDDLRSWRKNAPSSSRCCHTIS